MACLENSLSAYHFESPERRFKVNPRRTRNPGSRYVHLWPELAFMPMLDHWPDRPAPFDPDRSEVLGYIARTCDCDQAEAERIFRSAKYGKVIRFNPATKLWCGTKGGQA